MIAFASVRRSLSFVAILLLVAMGIMGCSHFAPPPEMATTPRLKEGAAPASAQADAFMRRGREFEKRGQWEQALAVYRQAAKCDPLRAEAYRRQAVACDHLRDYPKAAVLYETALRLKPDDADLHCDVGYSLYLQGRWKESEKSLERSLELKQDHSAARRNLAMLYAHTDRPDEARVEFRKDGCTKFQAQAKLMAAVTAGHPAKTRSKGLPQTSDYAADSQRKKPAEKSTIKSTAGDVEQVRHEVKPEDQAAVKTAGFDAAAEPAIENAGVLANATVPPPSSSAVDNKQESAAPPMEPEPPMLELPVEIISEHPPLLKVIPAAELESGDAAQPKQIVDDQIIRASMNATSPVPATIAPVVTHHWIYGHLGWVCGMLAGLTLAFALLRWRSSILATLSSWRTAWLKRKAHVQSSAEAAEPMPENAVHASASYTVHFVPYQQ